MMNKPYLINFRSTEMDHVEQIILILIFVTDKKCF